MAYSYSTFTVTTATFTVPNTYSYDMLFVDTSVSNTPIVITLPSTSGVGGSAVRFLSVTSVAGGDTGNNSVTIQTAASTDSIFFTGMTQTLLPKNGYLELRAQDNGSTGLWTSPAMNESIDGIYGDGGDGSFVATGTNSAFTTGGVLYTDVYFQNMLVPTGISIKTNGFRVFVRDLLTMYGGSSIHNNGADGVNGAAGAGGAGGAATTVQYFAGTGGGGAGGTNSANGTNAPTTGTTQSIGGSGGAGGATVPPATARNGGTGGTTTAVTTANGGRQVVKQIVNSIGGFLPTGVRFNAANGGGGGGSNAASGGGGGGAGAGIMLLSARNIAVYGTGVSLSARGGNGGNGGGAVASGGGGGGGGAAIIITQTPNLQTNYTTQLTVSTSGGIGGTGVGTGSQSGVDGGVGTTAVITSA